MIGATGNVGTSLVSALAADDSVDEIVGVARRWPAWSAPKTTWVAADVERDDLTPILAGADCVVHLAWRIQPSHDLAELRRTNVDGSERVFRAVADAGVPALVYASSVGAYSPGPKDRRVDESWPTDGTPTSFYARHKAEVERLLDRFEAERPETRVVRLRPALIFKRESAAEQRRYFLGALFPSQLASRATIPAVPDLPRLRFQAVHSLDVGEAYRLAVVGDARGAFNIAAEPVLDAHELGRALGARPVGLPAGLVRGAMSLSWRLRLQPTPPGWLDMALSVPLLDTRRATGSWVLPRIACGSGGGTSAAFWVGIGGFSASSQSLEQLGTSADCSPAGTVAYLAWIEIVPAPARYLSLRVSPGDRIVAAVAISGQTVTLSMKDVTHGTRSSTRVVVAHPLDTASAEWIAEAPSLCRTPSACDVVPLSNFGRVGFSGIAATADGAAGTLADPAWLVTPVALVTSSGVGAFPGASNPSGAVPGPPAPGGRAFTVSFRSKLTGAAPPSPFGGAPLPPWVHEWRGYGP